MHLRWSRRINTCLIKNKNREKKISLAEKVMLVKVSIKTALSFDNEKTALS